VMWPRQDSNLRRTV